MGRSARSSPSCAACHSVAAAMSEGLGQHALQKGYTYKVVQAPYGSDLFKECTKLRIEVFVDEQKYSLEEEMDSYDEQCIHVLLLATDDGGKQTTVGNLRYFPADEQQYGVFLCTSFHLTRQAGGH